MKLSIDSFSLLNGKEKNRIIYYSADIDCLKNLAHGKTVEETKWTRQRKINIAKANNKNFFKVNFNWIFFFLSNKIKGIDTIFAYNNVLFATHTLLTYTQNMAYTLYIYRYPVFLAIIIQKRHLCGRFKMKLHF